MDKRDQVIANIALNLQVVDPARLQHALQLKAQRPGVPLERVLIDAQMIDATGYQRLAAAFNQVLQQAREQDARIRAAAQASEQVFDEPTMVVPDDDEQEDDVFDEPTMVVPDDDEQEDEARSAPFQAAPGVPILDVTSDDNVFDEPTMVVADTGSYGDDELAFPEDEGDVFDEPTMVVSDEPAYGGLALPEDDEDVFDEPTMVVADGPGDDELDVPDDESVFDQATMVVHDSSAELEVPEFDEDELLAQPTMIVSDEPTQPTPNELLLQRPTSDARGPGGRRSNKAGPLDREEFQHRLKLRLGFEGCSLGDYLVHGEIARGAFGVVLEVEATGVTGNLAKQRGYKGRMALKVALENKADPRETERFLHETRVQIRFDHPHIVRIFDCGVEQGLTYYSMELIEGVEARAYVLRNGPMPPLLAARITMEVADALAYVHGERIYHRDLKPQNVLIDQSQQPYRAVLIDFGLVVESDSSKDKGLIVGTPSYMPPEQAQPRGGHGSINGTTDIYSLGATLFFLLTGRAPFTGRDPRKIIKQLVANPPPDPQALNPQVSKGLAEITLKCLEKRQQDRYHSAKLLAADLEKEIKSGKLKLKAKTFLGRFGLGKKK